MDVIAIFLSNMLCYFNFDEVCVQTIMELMMNIAIFQFEEVPVVPHTQASIRFILHYENDHYSIS